MAKRSKGTGSVERSGTVKVKAAGTVKIKASGKDARGREHWQIVGEPGVAPRTVATSAKSVAFLDWITVERADALKRLAKK